MRQRTFGLLVSPILLTGVVLWAAAGLGPVVDARQAAPAGVPADLRPLLTPRQSEMRMVVRWYTLDRQTLDGNYAGATQGGRGGGRGGRGQGVAEAPAEIVPVSPARLSRLKRFDLSWQEALARLDGSRLTDAARGDLASLRETIAANLQALEAQHAALTSISALVPFRQTLVDLIEARIRVQEMDAARAAGVLDTVTREIAASRARLEREGAPRPAAARAAQMVDLLRRDMDEWFGFYNGYDPLFTWWMGVPYKEGSAALIDYAAFLQSDVPEPGAGPYAVPPISPVEPAPANPHGDVPDLQALLTLPQDELTEIVRRFRGVGEGGRRGGGPPPAPSADDYRRWLDALETLDFDALSRNAQLNYLFIRRTSQIRLERAGVTLPANPPRKTDDSGIPGDARGRQGLIWDLVDEVIPYTPEELIALADREFAWVEEEMKKASRELGYGDDWKRAVEHVKNQYPPPGGQPVAVRDMLHEAIDYLRAHDLVTVPQVATESLPMIMMSPERQLVNPFFTGGTRISVSYPTDTMTYAQRMQSLRGNNYGFSHAVAHHEMIPGHNLTFYTGARYDGYRADLGASTPFFTEGWALYWELLLWDRGFNDTPEERIGALFWRMHRCARIVFSLRFHMGDWSPQEAIDFLVDRVGHERENATAEVRRSFQGNYGPLYQMAYLLGGIQIRSLHRELVESGRMTARAFHDEILRQGSMPIALLRLATSNERLRADMSLDWKFYGDIR
ncbi:MAG TPA: DUF885 family protein [Vicinamibacterales bacterium]|nr:DUF885 family protein [Vicinamibacterales bacterium]